VGQFAFHEVRLDGIDAGAAVLPERGDEDEPELLDALAAERRELGRARNRPTAQKEA
jgi:hypothetical protein